MELVNVSTYPHCPQRADIMIGVSRAYMAKAIYRIELIGQQVLLFAKLVRVKRTDLR